MKKILLIILAALPFLVNAQGPGGVGLPAIWLKGDAGVTPTTNGANITGWVNQGTIPFTLLPGATAPTYHNGTKPAVNFVLGQTMNFDQVGTELSSVLGDGVMDMKYDVFIVATGATSGSLIYLGPTNPGTNSGIINHVSFGKRAIYYNNTASGGSNVDGETGYYGPTAVTNNVREAYTPNVSNGAIPSDLSISNISSSPVNSYIDVNSLVFSVNGFGHVKQTDGVTSAAGGNRDYLGKEPSYGGSSNKYNNANVTKVFLGGVLNAAGTGLRPAAPVRNFAGNYHEIIIFPRRLTTEERQKVYSYLAAKYGVYLAHDQGAYSIVSPTLGTGVGNGQSVNNGTYFASDGTTAFFKRDTENTTETTDYVGTTVAGGFVKDVYYPLPTAGTNDHYFFLGRDDNGSLDSRFNIYKEGTYFEKSNKSTGWTSDKSFLALVTNGKDRTSFSTNAVTTPFPTDQYVKGRMPRTWKLTNTGMSGENIVLNFNVAAFITASGATASNAYLLISDSPNFPSAGIKAIKASVADANWITFNNVNINTLTGAVATGSSAIKYFTIAIANDGAPEILPVELTSFTAKSNGSSVGLKWTTATESNASHFDVTRSADGSKFASIGKVSVTGSGSTYNYTDFSPVKGNNYYQLVSVDLDGTSKTSSIEVAKIAANGNELSVTATAATNVTINVYASKATTGTVTASNVTGQKISMQAVKLVEGNNTITVSTATAKGLIILSLNTAEGTLSKKIIK